MSIDKDLVALLFADILWLFESQELKLSSLIIKKEMNILVINITGDSVLDLVLRNMMLLLIYVFWDVGRFYL